MENGAFRQIATVNEPQYDVRISDRNIHSYRITAGNEGGTAFPSEVLALYDDGSGVPKVNIVNGFTRVSAPESFNTGEYSGFSYHTDGGVADVCDIIHTGAQYDFSATSAYIGNDAPGFGASRGNLEKTVTAGNTHDFVYLHGRAVRAAGYGFVSASASAFADDVVITAIGAPGNPPVTDLILGKQREILPGDGSAGTRFKAFPEQLQRRIETYCWQGGSLLVSGSFIATDMCDNRFSDDVTRERDCAFASQTLGYDWQLGKGTVDGKVVTVPSPFKPFGVQEHLSFAVEPGPDSYAVESPDAIRPAGRDCATVMRYEENGLSAAVAMERAFETPSGVSSYRVVAMGFPFETITGEKARHNLMADILKFLSGHKNTGNHGK